MSIIGLLIVLVVFCLAIWVVRMLLGAFGIGDPISSIVQVVVVIVFVLWLIQTLGFLGSGPAIHIR